MAVLKIVLTFILIILLLHRKIGLGKVMLIGSLFLGLLFHMPLIEIIRVTLHAAVAKSTLSLMTALILIMFLENVMRQTGMLEKMLKSLKTLAGDRRIVMAALPAFMGLLPSPGGARFSCPMVDESSRESDLTPEDKSYINFWFRHIWEYVLPLYPGILLFHELSEIPVYQIVLYQIPFTFLAVAIGFRNAFGRIKLNPPQLSRAEAMNEIRHLFRSLWPIPAILILALVLKLDISWSIALVLVSLFIVRRYSPRAIIKTVQQSFSLNVVILTLGVMVFKEMLTASQAMAAITESATSAGIPHILIASLLPFVIGLLTGLTQPVIAISFPILVGLTHNQIILTLAFVSGFAGVMLSPLHLCFILTVDYFKTSINRIYTKVLIGESILVGTALIVAVLKG